MNRTNQRVGRALAKGPKLPPKEKKKRKAMLLREMFAPTPEEIKAAAADIETARTWRQLWRGWLMKPEVVARMRILCMSGMSEGMGLLRTVLQMAYARPQPADLGKENPRPIRITVGSGGNEVKLDYAPMGEVPGMQRDEEEAVH